MSDEGERCLRPKGAWHHDTIMLGRAMDDWLRRVAAAVGSDEELDGADADALLKIARIAAHDSDDRRNAPLLCYLIGRMRSERPLDEILAEVRAASKS
jgi:hypothetical protein